MIRVRRQVAALLEHGRPELPQGIAQEREILGQRGFEGGARHFQGACITLGHGQGRGFARQQGQASVGVAHFARRQRLAGSRDRDFTLLDQVDLTRWLAFDGDHLAVAIKAVVTVLGEQQEPVVVEAFEHRLGAHGQHAVAHAAPRAVFEPDVVIHAACTVR